MESPMTAEKKRDRQHGVWRTYVVRVFGSMRYGRLTGIGSSEFQVVVDVGICWSGVVGA